MRVLVVLGGYYPAQTYGGPTVSIDNLCSLLCDLIDFYIITSDHELNARERLTDVLDGWNVRSNNKVLYLRQNENRKSFFYKIVADIKPDLIYINSLFSADKTIPFLKIAYKNHIPVLLAPRGEICVNSFNKKYKKIPYIKLIWKYLHADNIWYQSTSDEETSQICKVLHVQQNRIFRLTNIPSGPCNERTMHIKNAGSCRLVFISRIQEKKNLDYALNILKSVKANVQFDIYGPIEDEKYWNECKKIICCMPSNISVTYKRKLNHDEVGMVFSKYDAFLFPTKSENYGHVIAEAMFSGCIVVTSDNVPWTDMNVNNSGWALPLSEPQRYIDVIEEIASYDDTKQKEMIRNSIDYVTKKTNINEIYQKYINAFENMSSFSKI